MDAKERQKLEEEALAEYKRKMESIKTVFEMSNRSEGTPRSITVADAMREAIKKLGEPFNIWEVSKQMEVDFPQFKGKVKTNTVSGNLTRMFQRGELEVVKQGSGTSPSTYRLKRSNTT